MDEIDTAIVKVFALQNGRRFDSQGAEMVGDTLLDAPLDSIDVPSLLLLELVMMLEDEISVEIEDVDAAEIRTLRDIKLYVKST